MLLVNFPVVGDSSPTNQQVCFSWDDEGNRSLESPWIQQNFMQGMGKNCQSVSKLNLIECQILEKRRNLAQGNRAFPWNLI